MTSSSTVGAVVREVEEPIRAELFSAERLEQHAESLAAAQLVTGDRRAGRPLVPRVAENGRLLLEYYRSIARAVQQEHTITPAAEWLVDNFYIVEEQLREIRDDLPAGYYRELPKLASGHLEGYPRVYGIAWGLVAHTDSRFDPETLRRFVTAYQRVQELTIGELWAVAITLRIVLVENLRRVAELIVRSRAARREADQFADRLLGTAADAPVDPQVVLRDFEKKPLQRSFAVQLVQRLRDLDPKVGPILRWLDERLAAQGTTADDIVRAEHQAQAATSVTVRNVITSMRLTSAWDWRAFFESTSLVDAILREGSAFDEMDFTTRDSYRHAIEDLARGSGHPETEIARKAVERARRAAAEGTNHSRDSAEADRRADPGFYLISQGRRVFERELGFRVQWRRRLLRLYVRRAVAGYLGSIAALTAIVLAFPLIRAHQLGVATGFLVLLGILAAIPASDLAIALINRVVTDLFDPRTLPRLDLKDGVPEHLRTMVVVPTLLSSVEDVREQVAHLEIHYLGNSEGDLRFALLTDWVDAAAETLPTDEELVAAAAKGIAGLNARHGPPPGGGPRFLLFHRKRVWNESQQKWMGWERKRGKLEELNQFLRGSTETTFIPIGGHSPEAVPGVRYVVTLDSDTRVLRNSVAHLVGTMAHPLNRPAFSASEGRVVTGYGLVQPRVNHSLPSDGQGSLFQRIFSGPAGIDPYASAVSDVYQDLFQEGSFTGKGIYDVDAFNASLGGRVEENTLLSHDLLEGVFVRCALATDIELFEEYPSHYEGAAARQHRWVRGDWQLLPWILGIRRPLERRSAAAAHSCRRPLEDDRQSAAQPFRPVHVSHDARGLARAGCLAVAVDAVHSCHDRDSLRSCLSSRDHPAPGRNLEAQPYSRRAVRRVARRIADRAERDVSRLPGVADVGRDPAYAGALIHHTQEPARVGHRRTCEALARPEYRAYVPANGRRGGARFRGASDCGDWDDSRNAGRSAILDLMGRLAGCGADDQPSAASAERQSVVPRRRARAPFRIAADLAILRDIRHGS